MLTALLATPAGLHNCQTCWVHSVRLHDPGPALLQDVRENFANRQWDFDSNDADVCCESWGGAREVKRSYVVWGISSQGQPPTGNLSGTTSYQGLGEADMPLGALLQSYFA